MRAIILWVCFSGVALGAVELEVRAYRVPADDEYAKYEVLPNSPFESRFFREGDVLRDLTGWAKERELLESEGDLAVWNEATGRLVVRGNRYRHHEVEFRFSRQLECQLRFGIRVVKVPGVMAEVRSLKVSDLPKGLVEVGNVGGLAKNGANVELRGSAGELEFEGFVGAWGGELGYQLSVNLSSRVKGAVFDFKGTFEGLSGEESVFEIGSRSGKETILAIVKGEVVFANGELRDDWVLDEDGGRVWREERVLEMRNPGYQLDEKDGGKIRRRFTVPPTFMTFLSSSGQTEEGKDIRVLLMENGVPLKDDDEVSFLKRDSVFRVKVSPLAMELIEGIIGTGEKIPFGVLQANMVLVESDEKLDREAISQGGFRVLSKICHWDDRSGGTGGEVRMGPIDSELVISDVNHATIWTSGSVRSRKGGELSFRGELREGVPLILQQVKVEEKWRAWVATVFWLDVNGFLKDKK